MSGVDLQVADPLLRIWKDVIPNERAVDLQVIDLPLRTWKEVIPNENMVGGYSK